MITYDPEIIHKYATKLYDRALAIVVLYAFTGGVSVALIGFFFLDTLPQAAFVGLIGLLTGAALGNQQAFSLKLEAQLAMCQAKIEANTRQALQIATAQATHVSAR